MCPSWCLTIRLRGHTFEADRQHFIPHYVLDSPKVSVVSVYHMEVCGESLMWRVLEYRTLFPAVLVRDMLWVASYCMETPSLGQVGGSPCILVLLCPSLQ